MEVTMTSGVRRWAAGVGLAGGAAVTAAIIGAAGTPVAHADALSTDIGLLTTAETDVNDGLTALSQLPGAGGGTPPPDLGELTSQFEAVQTPLLSSDNSVVSGLGELLFNSPDQQLAQSAETFLSAADAYAADPTSLTNTLDVLSATFQWSDSLLFDSLPANVIGKLVDQVAGYDIGSVSAAADSATSASPTPDEEIGQTISVLDQTTAVLAAAPTTDLGTRSADLLTGQEALPGQLDPILTQIGSLQDEFNPTDQTLLGYVDELMVSSAQNIGSADQGFVAADQAGDLSGNSVAPADLAVIGADLNFLDSFLTADGASIFADLTGGLDVSSAADLASSLDPATAFDPSIFADLLASIGF
jgi:hypothetical protein